MKHSDHQVKPYYFLISLLKYAADLIVKSYGLDLNNYFFKIITENTHTQNGTHSELKK